MSAIPQLSRRHVLASILAATTAVFVQPAQPATYPERPVKLVVPSSPGGGADALARLVGERLTRALGQTVLVENKGGGGGNIATEAVAKAPADGYTLLLTGNNHTINVSLFAKPPYKLDDFTPIIELVRIPSVFVSATNAPFSSLAELLTQAKAAPDTISYGSPGIGLPSHIAFEMFKHEAKVNLVHVPYKGSGPSLADALGGQIPVVSSTLAAAMSHINGGKLKALAVTSDTRWPSLPDVPTVGEVIGKPFSHLTWLGVLAPKGTPDAVVARLNTEMNKIISDPEVRANLEKAGNTIAGGTMVEFRNMIDQDARTSKALVESAKLRAD